MNRLSIYYPSKPFRINQGFAANNVCSNPDRTGIVDALPNGYCPAGKVKLYPLLGMNKGHTGLDLYAPDGFILRAPHEGIVCEIQLEPSRGLGVGIVTKNKYDIRGYGLHYAKTRQWHGKKILVELGQEVKIGQPVMIADNTGASSGSHNHFELKPVEYDDKGEYYNFYQDNGWFGSINPLPFFNGLYAEDYEEEIEPEKIKVIEKQITIIQKIINLLKEILWTKHN